MPQIANDRTVAFACTFTSMWSETPSEEPATWTTCLFGMHMGDGCSENVPRYEYNNLIYGVDVVEAFGGGAVGIEAGAEGK